MNGNADQGSQGILPAWLEPRTWLKHRYPGLKPEEMFAPGYEFRSKLGLITPDERANAQLLDVLMNRHQEDVATYQKPLIAQAAALAMAPPIGQMQQQFPGIPVDPSQIKTTLLPPVQLPGLNPADRTGFVEPPVSVPGRAGIGPPEVVPMEGEPGYAFRYPHAATTGLDPMARPTMAQAGMYQQLLGGHLVDPRAKLVPPGVMSSMITSTEATERQNMSVEEQKAILESFVASGQMPQKDYDAMVPKLKPQKYQAFDTMVRELINPLQRQGTQTLDDTAVAFAGKHLAEIGPTEIVTPEIEKRIKQLLPESPVKAGDNLRQTIAGLKTLEVPGNIAQRKAIGELSVPADRRDTENYFSVKHLEQGILKNASDLEPGITTLDLRKSTKYKPLSQNDQQELQNLNNARNTLRELFDRSEYLLEPTDQLAATTIQPTKLWAWAHGGPGANDLVRDRQGNVIGTKGDLAKSFLDQQKSFGGVVARGVLAERGVLTDADRNVATLAGVTSTDTVRSMKQKQQFFEKLMKFQFKALARITENPNAPIDELIKEKNHIFDEARKNGVVTTYNDPEKERRYQEWLKKNP